MNPKKVFEARRKVRHNFPFYSQEFLKIRTKSGKIEPFVFNTIQKRLHTQLETQKKQTGKVRALILKGRQQGCSTYVGGRFYHLTTHYRGVRTFILTHELEATNNLFDMVTRFHEHIVPEFKPSTGKSNRKELIFDGLDSGYRVGTAGSKGVGRSATIQLFHGSEVAFWPNAEEHAAGILQAIPDNENTEVILESTANGLGNFFHQKWQEAEVGASDYIPVFIPWYLQDEYRQKPDQDFKLTDEETNYQNLYNLDLDQIAWRRKKIIELGDPLLFKQEYPATPAEAFQVTGIESYLPSDDIIRARHRKPYKSTQLPVLAGFDPAREGDDRDAFIYRQGLDAFGLEYLNFKTFPERIAFCLEKLECKDPFIDTLFIDYGGSGWEIGGILNEAGYEDRIKIINFGSAAYKKNAYYNKRAEMYGELKKWLIDPDQPPCLPDENALHSDLTATSFTYDSKTRVKLESKKDIKKRGLRSPDGADALALTFAFPIKTKRITTITPIETKSYF